MHVHRKREKQTLKRKHGIELSLFLGFLAAFFMLTTIYMAVLASGDALQAQTHTHTTRKAIAFQITNLVYWVVAGVLLSDLQYTARIFTMPEYIISAKKLFLRAVSGVLVAMGIIVMIIIFVTLFLFPRLLVFTINLNNFWAVTVITSAFILGFYKNVFLHGILICKQEHHQKVIVYIKRIPEHLYNIANKE